MRVFIRFLSRRVLSTLEAFGDWVEAGGLEEITDRRSRITDRKKLAPSSKGEET